MNKALITLSLGIWGIALFLNFIFNFQLSALQLSCEQITSTLFPLTLVEIIAFAIAIIGILKRE